MALFRNCIIELCKIIKGSKNNYFNIFSIIKSLKKRTDLNEIDLTELNNIESKIKETTDLTERIINLRNDFIAHTKLEKEDPEITFDELDKYILNFEEIIKSLFSIINNSHFEYSPILFKRDRFHIISILAKDKTDRLMSISDKLNSRKKIER
ncbi:hypothetical protein [uncultured Dokdonia sp.]|uniref:AbiU2 domain-containing protein n=1 Tax=uncultured Dokdonia sp. TaxID=575653 RepID=UPI0034359D3D